MIALIQRVKSSSVKVDGKEIAKIGKGFNILLGIVEDDTSEDIDKLIKKIVKMRIFENDCGKFDLSILDVDGEVLVVSQFTLSANIKKGNRPSFSKAMNPKDAKVLYREFVEKLSNYVPTKEGIFGAMMEVEIINDGPVTIIANSKEI